MTLLFAAAVPESPSDSISVEAAIMVLMAGAILYCLKVVADLGRRMDRLASGTRATRTVAPERTSPRDHVSPEIVAVISAAVYESFGAGYRVLNVRPESVPAGQTWSLEGRRQVFQSHQVR